MIRPQSVKRRLRTSLSQSRGESSAPDPAALPLESGIGLDKLDRRSGRFGRRSDKLDRRSGEFDRRSDKLNRGSDRLGGGFGESDRHSEEPDRRFGQLDGPAAERALDRAVQHLLARQDKDGWWRGLLETNVTMDAEDLLMRQFLGIRTAAETEASARWIRSQQRADGSWANFYGGPPDPSTTAEAYIALRLAGDAVDEDHMVRARDIVLAHGGLAGTRVFTRIWLALFGLWEWDEVPALPPELIFWPRQFPLNLYDFGCWARQTIAPLTILVALRPQRDLGVEVDELRVVPTHRGSTAATGWGRFFGGLDTGLHSYQRRPLRPLRRLAIKKMEQWVIQRQEADGSWGGIQPPWVYSLMALHALGHPLDGPELSRGLAGLDRFTVTGQSPAGPIRWLEACQSPVWDTALAVIALADAGLDPAHTAVRQAEDWLLAEEIGVRGDWAVTRPRTPAGGWAFEFDNDLYPDIDDTAEVVLALRKGSPGRQGAPRSASPARDRGPAPGRAEPAVRRAVAWISGMQSADGGWGAFDADNNRELAYQLPFCDFGAVIDPPSADVTAHVVEMLAQECGAGDPRVQRGVDWLLSAQEPGGSWFGRWGANHVYGTGAVLPALVAAGIDPGDRVIRRAVGWLTAHQNEDGGWGEDLRSYADPSWIGRGASTASQTGWALLALHAAAEAGSAPAQAGIQWLVDRQRDDGGWDEPQFTGTGFPGDFYINYHLYRIVFPISALGRCLGRAA